jgi:NADH-quinone oxidoreductase subunit M
VLLTTFLTPIALLGAGGSVKDKHREFVACMLVLETGMLGAFVALDMVLFYVFWELMLVPMYLLIGIWGGENRIYAAIKFVLYTMVGSVLMLVAILYLYFKFHALTGTYSFGYADWNRMILTPNEQLLCFGAFALSFAIKVPIFPLHTWLPDAHVEAPTPGSVILAGVLLKLGTYGLLRFAMPLFPYAATKLAPVLATLGIVGILYGAFLAWAQGDAKKLIAYSSISHLGFVVLGLMTLDVRATEGAIFIMLAHGITSGGLFLGFGMLYERRHTRLMNEYGGIWKVLPTFSALYLIILLGSVGLPGLCGFVGEFLVLLGAFDHSAAITAQGMPVMLPHPKIMTAFAALGVIFGAVYLLTMFQKIFFGPVTNPKNETLQDVGGRELAALVPLVVLVFVMGLFPTPMLRRMEPSVKQYLAQYQVKHKASLDAAKGTPRAVVLDARVLADARLAPLPGKKRADVAPPSKRRGRAGVKATVPGRKRPSQAIDASRARVLRPGEVPRGAPAAPPRAPAGGGEPEGGR